ncbi:winged helix-turn-helix domain-containing protein [Enterococcus ureasiticus]|uniref:Transcriptional regulator n=1 Tax=Enterococcus ureasiticus TaxID=903984 RepID=A0A1E5GAU1_9ENTE|nr:winged helix-turn-helix domain-containing protein [Enterococcus ureasiticus]OEG09725.1 transcriptional regulator [Enterococcus ureasiticus]
MYNIGIISASEHQNNTYVQRLKKTTYQVYTLDKDEVVTKASQMDALVIEETSELSLQSTCEIILELRKSVKGLIWVLSENLSKTSKLIYLQLGADGVTDKEEEQEEFILQLSNILKRVKEEKLPISNPNSIFEQKISESSLELIPNNLSVLLEGESEINLTKLEFQTISFLVKHTGQAVTYEEIYQNVWKDDFNNCEEGNKQYRVSNLIFHLRKKLETDTTKPKYIKTIRSKGYMLAM